jgi:hypothetical protein
MGCKSPVGKPDMENMKRLLPEAKAGRATDSLEEG